MPVVRKTETDSEIKINHRLYIDNIDWVLDKGKCKKCDICATVCPKEAISVEWVKDEDTGEDALKFLIDESKCVFCEVCVPFCPSNAISIFYNGEKKNILVNSEGLPLFPEKFTVDATKCPKDCTECEKECPADAIKVTTPNKVEFFEDKCLRCPSCELACPVSTIKVNPVFFGTMEIDQVICSTDCKSLAQTIDGTSKAPVCVEACPTNAMVYDAGKKQVNIDSRVCIYCGACTNACRDEGALTLKRTRIMRKSDDVSFSSAWDFALQNLAGMRAAFVDHEGRVRDRIVSMLKEDEKVIE